MRWRRRRKRVEHIESARVPSEEAGLFAFLEDCLADLVVTPQLAHQSTAVTRAVELANDDWPEAAAARELLWLVAGDRRVLYRLQEVFEGRMLRSMLTELLCLRAGRVVDAALVQSYVSGTG